MRYLSLAFRTLLRQPTFTAAWISRATLPWRSNHAMAYDDVRQRTAIVGGETGYISRADVWEWRYVDGPPPACEPAP